MPRTVKRVALVLLGLAVVAYLARDLVVRQLAQAAVSRRTGFSLEIGAVGVGLLGGTFDVRDLRLSNPPDWPERRFVDLPLLHVDYDTLSVLRRRPHLRELVVEVTEVHVVTNAGGVKNTSLLATRAGGDGAARRDTVPYRVDLVRVHVGTVVVDDYSRGRHTQRRIALNSDATYRNVSESTSLSELVMGSVFGQLGPVAGDVAKGVGEAFKGAGGAVNRTGQGLLDAFKRKR